MKEPIYRFACPEGVRIEEGYAAVGFKYRLAGRRIHITTLPDGVFVVTRRRRKSDEPIGTITTATAKVDISRFFVDTHLRLSMDAIRCIANFAHHIEVQGVETDFSIPTVLTRKTE